MFNRRKKQSSRNKTLRVETLQQRQLMAADIDLSGGLLSIETDDHSHEISVRNVSVFNVNTSGRPSSSTELGFSGFNPTSRVLISVLDTDTGQLQREYASLWRIWDIDIDAGRGHDRIDVRIDRPATIAGGAGNDTIYGGGADDVLMGGSGVDRIYGRSGNDQIDGGSSIDFLYGGNGADVIKGGSGNDYLRGQNGNDRLMGGSGVDDLEGGAHNDVLIGGRHMDFLHSGSGLDRFLVVEGDNDIVQDKTAWDTQIDFVNSSFDTTVSLGSNIGWATADAARWTDADIVAVDEGFELLFSTTGNNALLKKADQSNLRFIRYGALEVDGDVNTSVLGWNGGTDIVVLDNAINGSFLLETVIHEVGHHFDEQSENPFIDEFRDVSGWQQRWFWQSKQGLTQADDANWSNWYFESDTVDTFAREYGTMNPREDFATAFTAAILSGQGENYFNDSPANVQESMAGRIEVLDDFFASLA